MVPGETHIVVRPKNEHWIRDEETRVRHEMQLERKRRLDEQAVMVGTPKREKFEFVDSKEYTPTLPNAPINVPKPTPYAWRGTAQVPDEHLPIISKLFFDQKLPDVPKDRIERHVREHGKLTDERVNAYSYSN